MFLFLVLLEVSSRRVAFINSEKISQMCLCSCVSCVFDSLCLPTYHLKFGLYVLWFGVIFFYAIIPYSKSHAWILIWTLLSSSWGPDDDGHTVDGPHPLGKVRESQSWQFVVGTFFVLQGAVHCNWSEQHACRNTGSTVGSLSWLFYVSSTGGAAARGDCRPTRLRQHLCGCQWQWRSIQWQLQLWRLCQLHLHHHYW